MAGCFGGKWPRSGTVRSLETRKLYLFFLPRPADNEQRITLLSCIGMGLKSESSRGFIFNVQREEVPHSRLRDNAPGISHTTQTRGAGADPWARQARATGRGRPWARQARATSREGDRLRLLRVGYEVAVGSHVLCKMVGSVRVRPMNREQSTLQNAGSKEKGEETQRQ